MCVWLFYNYFPHLFLLFRAFFFFFFFSYHLVFFPFLFCLIIYNTLSLSLSLSGFRFVISFSPLFPPAPLDLSRIPRSFHAYDSLIPSPSSRYPPLPSRPPIIFSHENYPETCESKRDRGVQRGRIRRIGWLEGSGEIIVYRRD